MRRLLASSLKAHMFALLAFGMIALAVVGSSALRFQHGTVQHHREQVARLELFAAMADSVSAAEAAAGVERLVQSSGANSTLSPDEPLGALFIQVRAMSDANVATARDNLAVALRSEHVDANVAAPAGRVLRHLDREMDVLSRRDAVRDAWNEFLRAHTQFGASDWTVEAIVDLSDLSVQMIDTSVQVFYPESFKQEAATSSVAAWTVERTSLEHLSATLPESWAARLDAGLSSQQQLAYEGTVSALTDEMAAGNLAAVRPSMLTTFPQVIGRLTVVGELSDQLSTQGVTQARADLAAATRHLIVLAAVLAFGAAGALAAGLVTVRRVVGGVRRLTAGLSALAAGQRPRRSSRVEIAELAAASASLAELEAALVDVADTADAVACGETPGQLRLSGELGDAVSRAFLRVVATQAELADREDLLQSVFSSSSTALVMFADDGLVLDSNVAAQTMFEDTLTERVDPLLSLLAVEQLAQLRNVERPLPDGRHGLVSLVSSSLSDGSCVWVLSVHDLSERKQFEDTLARMAVSDPLTGLPNRAGLTVELDRLARAGGAFNVLFIDLDRFKLVNDTFGHAAGDELLKAVVARIGATVRAGDIVSRLAGDEFVVVSPSLPAEGGEILAGRLVDNLSEPFRISAGDVRVGASVGVRFVPARTSGLAPLSGEEILAGADLAMYSAKHAGRGRVSLWTENMAQDAAARIELGRDLVEAVRARQLEAFFQPVFSTSDRSVEGFELLVRWCRDGVMVRPDEFIPLAEESDLIVELGRWVLDEACETISGWRAAGVSGPLHVAVNISGRHLTSGTLAADIAASLSRFGCDSADLVVELTETSLVNDIGTAVDQLNAIRALGVKVSIDDFGTGYASLSYLSRLPVDVIKIDRSFISAGENGVNHDIVRAVSALAASLQLGVVAEGIETDEQLATVAELGCGQGQGYLVGAAMPRQQAGELLASLALTPEKQA